MISICIPTYNRTNMVLESFSEIIDNEIISEIIIVDDNSVIDMYNDLSKMINNLNSNKIKLFRNEKNKKAFLNKIESVSRAENDWVIILDSDNILTRDYIDSIPSELDETTFYLPSRARCDSPYLDYRDFVNINIDKNDYKNLDMNNVKVQCLLNTGNYLVNKKTYLKAFELEENILECYALDPFYHTYLCFKNIDNFKLNIVTGMEYYHRLHNGGGLESNSYYIENSYNSSQFQKQLVNRILEL